MENIKVDMSDHGTWSKHTYIDLYMYNITYN